MEFKDVNWANIVNNYLCCVRQSLMLLLSISIVTMTFFLSVEASEKVNGLQFTAHSDGTLSVISQSIPLEMLLHKISKTTNVDIYVNSASKKRPITINAKNIKLIQLLKRIAKDNYAMVYDGHNVTDLHVLPQGKGQSAKLAAHTFEFSGQIKISNHRAMMFFMPTDQSKSTIDNYIKKRHEALSKLSKEDPLKELHAQISFQRYMSANQIVAFVKQNQLDPVTLNIGWRENSGEYDLKREETIEAAIQSATLNHERFISQLQEDADMQVASLRKQGISDIQMQSELAFQKNADDLTSIFYKKGVPFYGMRVAASANKLHTLTINNQAVRLVDPLWGGSVEDEITNIYPTTKIAIPFIPENETFIP